MRAIKPLPKLIADLVSRKCYKFYLMSDLMETREYTPIGFTSLIE